VNLQFETPSKNGDGKQASCSSQSKARDGEHQLDNYLDVAKLQHN